MSVTFKSAKWRVQLRVFDLQDGIKVFVTLLPSTAHPSTAFLGPGTPAYAGSDLSLALKLCERWLGYEPTMPPSMRQYLGVRQP